MEYTEYLKNKKSYQEAGELFLLERKHACLYYKPGKGKTYPCIDAIRTIDQNLNGNAKVLILSTADAIKNMWNVEIVSQKILPKNTTLYTFNSAIVDTRKYELLRSKWDIIVIDECHKIKSHNAKISKLVFNLSRKAEYVFGLSGTPRGNSDVDIFCQFHNMNIGEWGEISYTAFVDNCCYIDQKFFNGNCIKVPIGITERYKQGWERNIAMYTQRVDYDEDDNMPNLKVNEIKFPYIPTKEYLAAEQGVIEIPDYADTMTKLTAIQKLHQIVNGFIYVPDNNDECRRTIINIEENKKLPWLTKRVKEINNPTVIVYRFAADFEHIKEVLYYSKLSYTESVEDFKVFDYDVLLLQCARCESFNLQMCKNIIFFTLDYSYIKYNQMIHRVWRMGQQEDVTIDVLLFDDSIETKIWKSVQNKERLSELFMRIKE